jgi:hypothetical protein
MRILQHSAPAHLRPRSTRLGAVALALALGGCVPRVVAPAGAPVADAGPLAASIARATVPARPRQVSFTWTLNEQGSRVSGRGVVRVVAPERIRLDLFGPRGETYLAAALVGEDFRLPGGAPPGIPLPSPALLWGALGVVRPPAAATLLGATAADSVTSLRYRASDGDIFQYRVYTSSTATPRLDQLQRVRGTSVVESVQLDRSADGDLLRARYRDWSAYRELTLQVENAKDVAGFPEEIWTP